MWICPYIEREREFWKRSSGLYHRHLVNGMDVTILTSLDETNVHCYLSIEYLRNWWHLCQKSFIGWPLDRAYFIIKFTWLLPDLAAQRNNISSFLNGITLPAKNSSIIEWSKSFSIANEAFSTKSRIFDYGQIKKNILH